MGKAILCFLLAVAAFFGSLFLGGNNVLTAVGYIALLGMVIFFIKGIFDFIRFFINGHRNVRQSIDDERIQKVYDKFNKG